MDFKQETIGDILDSEKEMVLHGAERFGAYFIHASEINNESPRLKRRGLDSKAAVPLLCRESCDRINK